ncbi:TPA: hypothetical protein ACH3X2_008090 [Trebouxia sp. C0005]
MAVGVTSQLGCVAARTLGRSAVIHCRASCVHLSARKLPGFRVARASQLSRAVCRGSKGRSSALQVVSGAVQQVSQEQLEKELADRQVPLIIDFYATWCGPCVLLAKELEEVAAELGDKVKVLKIDTDQNPELSSQLQIQGLPTMVFVGMDPSKPALRTEGLLAAKAIKDIVQNELSAPAPAAPAPTA